MVLPNDFLNIVNNKLSYVRHKTIGNKVRMESYNPPYCESSYKMAKEKNTVSFFTTSYHVTLPMPLIKKDIETILAINSILLKHKLNLIIRPHPQLRNTNLINQYSYINNNANKSLEEFLSRSLFIISHWSTVIFQAASLGLDVILIDFHGAGFKKIIEELNIRNIYVVCNQNELEIISRRIILKGIKK